MGALSPYDIYTSQVKPSIDLLENLKGTIDYYHFYEIEWPKIEEARQQYGAVLMPLTKSFAMLELVIDYYERYGFKVQNTDGEAEDAKYNIDIIAENAETLIVAQIKSGAVSGTDVRRFCRLAPDYLAEHRNRREARLEIAAVYFGTDATEAIANCGIELLHRGILLYAVSPEQIEQVLPPDKRRIFKEWRKRQ
jgi:Holliday junction resolvase-like predicted endonuclease